MPPALKLVVPLVVLVGGVFALTYFSLNAPTDPTTGQAGVGPEEGQAVGKPLVFFTTTRQWDPRSPSLQDRAFQGFYEVDETKTRAAHFWFENRNRAEVTLQLKTVSCSACSGGRVAAIPPEVARQMLQASLAGVLPGGLLTGLGAPVAAGPAAHFDPARPTITWQGYEFKDYSRDMSQVRYTVPGSADPGGWAPQWGILELNFKVRPSPNLPLTADFVSRVAGSDLAGADRFSIMYRPVTPIEVTENRVDLPEVSPSVPERRGEFVAFSITRPDTPPPVVRVDLPAGAAGEPGEWVTAGPPVKLTPAELEALVAHLASATKGEPVRVAAAYRIPVVVRAAAAGRPADIGKMERLVNVAVGSEVRRVRVTATVRGPVYLSGEGKEVGFGTFRAVDGATVTADLITERPGTTLTWVRELTSPKYLQVDLQQQPTRGEFGGYRIKVTVPKNEQVGELSGDVVLEAAGGPVRQRVRLPVTGRATR